MADNTVNNGNVQSEAQQNEILRLRREKLNNL